jgi:hypothetical protein
MIGRLAGLRGTLSSHWLASAFAGVYLVSSLMLGVALLSMPKTTGPGTTPAASIPTIVYEDSPTQTPPGSPDNRDDSGPTIGPTTSTPTPTSPSKTIPTAPAGFQLVSGPAGLRTAIPTGWPSMRTTGPGAMQATDPVDAGRFVKYGGSLAPDLGIEPSHIQYENGFATRAADYKRIALSSANYGGHDAVEWEFEHRDGINVMHVRSLYWRVDGKEFFVMAAAPSPRWPQMLPIYETMVANATP